MKSLKTTLGTHGKMPKAIDEHGGVVASIINLVFGFILFVVSFRFVFQLLGANQANGLVDAVYGLSAPLVAPFSGMFSAIETGMSTARIDMAALIALVVYGLIAALINGVVGYNSRRVVS